MSQHRMRKRWMLLITLALVVTSVGTAAPAGADKPNCDLDPDHSSCAKDESSTPVLYDVSMSLVEDSDGVPLPGLSTFGLNATSGECTEDLRLVMVEEKLGSGTSLTAYGVDDTSEPDLLLVTPPAILSGGGCYPAHRGGISFDPERGPGFLRIAFDRQGTLGAITWHFDVVLDGMNVTHKFALNSQNKKGRNSVSLTWDRQSDDALTGEGLVSGPFELEDYDDGGVWTPLAGDPPLDLAFNLTIVRQE